MGKGLAQKSTSLQGTMPWVHYGVKAKGTPTFVSDEAYITLAKPITVDLPLGL